MDRNMQIVDLTQKLNLVWLDLNDGLLFYVRS